MIALAPVVDRLREHCPSFNAIDGAAEFSAIADRVTTHPAAWVVPLADAAGENRFGAGVAVAQRVETSFGIVLVCADRSDRQGAAAVELLTRLRREVLSAVLGWVPADGAAPLAFVGGDALRFSAGLTWWQDTYSTAWECRSLPGAPS